MITNVFQAKYEVSKLTEFSGFADAEKLVKTYMDNDLLVYPHQIVAALAAMEDPLRKGFILADEVGLGKGIEAMLVVSQYFYDGKKVCIVVPSPLEDMWIDLVANKFGLPLFGEKDGDPYITLLTYNEAIEHSEKLKQKKFDLAVFEEAHRLRKYHTGENKTSTIMHDIFEGSQKLLLTATPIQRNVMDIYGLVNFIDDTVLGDADTFYKRYYKRPENYAELKDLLFPYIFRTLRSQVKAMVNLPERNILTYSYNLDDPRERELNDKLFKYLGKAKKIAFPQMDNYELTLMLEKTFSSSIYALSKTLAGIVMRLRKMDTADAHKEADELQAMLELATSINVTSKGKAFIKALDTAMKSLKANEHNAKCIIFTENTETQKHILDLIKKHTKYKVAAYNGSTSNAPIEQFRAKTQILVSTDNGAEGFNFDFCNLVINFDNLWLASAIEQRIGRCHRIGQKSDVAVISFLCTELLADVRFYELAYKRLNMFGGILGATDNVVSDISSGEIQSRIQEIFAHTRNAEQTEADYTEATRNIADEIESSKTDINEQFFRTFDTEIAKRTKNYVQLVIQKTEQIKDKLWDIARYYLAGGANFYNENGKRSFSLTRSIYKSGNYTLSRYYIDYDKDTPRPQKFTLRNPIAREIIGRIQVLNPGIEGRIQLNGKGEFAYLSGTIAMYSIRVLDLSEFDTIMKTMLVGHDASGREIDPETIRHILELPCTHSDSNRSVYEKDKIALIKQRTLPKIVEQIKENFSQTISHGIKRIKAETEQDKSLLKVEIASLERQIARLSKDESLNEFALSQRIAELTAQLKKLKENEFLQRLRLKKQEDEKTKAFLDNFHFSTSDSLDFVVEFSIA